jgi:hypothetical protein
VHEADDRRVALGQRRLVGEVGLGSGCEDERDDGETGDERRRGRHGHDARFSQRGRIQTT